MQLVNDELNRVVTGKNNQRILKHAKQYLQLLNGNSRKYVSGN